jgi:hypothetical protein
LVTSFPWLTEAYHEHLRENSELLPHVLMGDITRLVAAFAGDVSRRDSLRLLMSQMDRALRTGGEEVQELITVSFVQNLMGEAAALRALRPLMGSALLAVVETICGK